MAPTAYCSFPPPFRRLLVVSVLLLATVWLSFTWFDRIGTLHRTYDRTFDPIVKRDAHSESVAAPPLVQVPVSLRSPFDGGEEPGTPLGFVSTGTVLILTPLKNARRHLDGYFERISTLAYNQSLISLGFLISDSLDGTIDYLRSKLSQLDSSLSLSGQGLSPHGVNLQKPGTTQLGSNRKRTKGWYRHVTVLQKDFGYFISEEGRHQYEIQGGRRALLAASRNTLLFSTLADHEWVLWLDVDVAFYPPTLLSDLIALDRDVLAPSCMFDSGQGKLLPYDLNSFVETNETREIMKGMEEDEVLVDGYEWLGVRTGRRYASDGGGLVFGA
ncbi:hypothetical protein HDU93_003285 [Gonapodya sp. JEL0774]|nr:hypothetical protein HDU93_003285 [Gonapodya sp. JEL0774]